MKILCHPIDSHKIVYVEIPKAGCTSIKAGLAKLRGPFYFYREQREQFHKRFGYTRLPDLATLWNKFETIWLDYFKFTVTRNPFTRFESLFYDKIAPTCEFTINEYVVQMLRKGRWLQDVHGAPQTSLIGTELEKYDFIGNLENFSETVKKMESLQVYFPDSKLNQSKKVEHEDLSPLAIQILRGIYSNDFQVLGYSRDYPSQ